MTIRRRTERTLALAAATLAFVQLSGASVMAQVLWIADNSTKTIYEVSLDGRLLSSFPHVNGATSGIDVASDPDGGSLWGTDESPGRVVNFTKTGELISFFTADVFGGASPEGVAVAADRTLWIVDQPVAGVPTIFHVTKEGRLLDSFATGQFDPESTSPQAIAFDPFDGTLWITDNAADAIYNVSTKGQLLDKIPTRRFGGASNLQGISVDTKNGTLWTTARKQAKIYNIKRTGEVIAAFETSRYASDSASPTGIAWSGPSR